jgi:hypothetical protein
MKKIPLFSIVAITLLFAKRVLAICPLCTISVGGGVGLARYLGVDDTISGLWIGGLIVSLIYWTIDWLKKKNIKFKGKEILSLIFWYLITILPLYFSGFLGNPKNSLLCFCGLYFDKLLLGMILGSSGFWLGAESYLYLKERHGGYAYFPFQKVLMPIFPLIILSLIFYFLTK